MLRFFCSECNYFGLKFVVVVFVIDLSWSCELLLTRFIFIFFVLDGDDWSIQCGILSDCTPALV